MKLLDEWLSIFDEFAYNSREYGTLVFHGLMGQVLKWQRIGQGGAWLDARISFFLMQDSGSGKSIGLEPARRVAEKLKLQMVSITAVTDAAVIGTVEKREVREGNTRKTEYVHIPGVLQYADILHWDEGSILLRSDTYSQNLKNILQQALNPIGMQGNIINKKLAHGDPITVAPTCSLFVTSYFPREFEETVLNAGLLQRMLVFPRAISPEERVEGMMTNVDRLGTQDADLDGRIQRIANRMESLQKEYMVAREWDFSAVRPLIKSRSSKMGRLIASVPGGTQDVMWSFAPRYQDSMCKIALHSAAINDRDRVRAEDVRYASDIVQPLLEAVLTVIETRTRAGYEAVQQERVQARRVRVAVHTAGAAGEWVLMATARRAIEERDRVSRKTAYRHIHRAIRRGMLETKTENGMEWVREVNPSPGLSRPASRSESGPRTDGSTSSPSKES